ncbi:solute carrier family 45 member 4-like [Latimeria chalumnae]|uniref:solute carrier family 45 member 4-like n=1 Tax=Latimeria chalumnae TaxID=7897 RepID=UPI00313E3BD1
MSTTFHCLIVVYFLLGFAFGDHPDRQPIGIILTVVGVTVLDFCADATEGPIHAYLLDVAENEERGTGLNIHALATGLGGAVGFMISGVDWMQTSFSRVFTSKNHILFFLSSVILATSLVVHLLSIQEQPLPRTTLNIPTVKKKSSIPNNYILPPVSVHDIETSEIYVNPYTQPSYKKSTSKRDLSRSKSDSELHLQKLRGASPQVVLFQNINFSFPDSKQAQSQLSTEQSLKIYTCQYQSVGNALVIKNEYFNEKSEAEGDPVITVPTTASGSTPSHQDTPLQFKLSASTAVKKRRRPTGRQTDSTEANDRHQSLRTRAGLLMKASCISSEIHGMKKMQREGKKTLEHSTPQDNMGKGEPMPQTTVELLWFSMFKMPGCLFCLCICHLSSWFSIFSASFFYTDFMGQIVYGGDPTAPQNSIKAVLYNSGVQMGCWGLMIFALATIIFSALLQKCLVNIKLVYCLGSLLQSMGMAIMAACPNLYIAVASISTMGFLFTSTSYCPYALLRRYHDNIKYVTYSPSGTRRSIGIDCAILSCQVYMAQTLVASLLGVTVKFFGTVRVMPVVSACGSLMSFLIAVLLVNYPPELKNKVPGNNKKNNTRPLEDGTDNGTNTSTTFFKGGTDNRQASSTNIILLKEGTDNRTSSMCTALLKEVDNQQASNTKAVRTSHLKESSDNDQASSTTTTLLKELTNSKQATTTILKVVTDNMTNTCNTLLQEGTTNQALNGRTTLLREDTDKSQGSSTSITLLKEGTNTQTLKTTATLSKEETTKQASNTSTTLQKEGTNNKPSSTNTTLLKEAATNQASNLSTTILEGATNWTNTCATLLKGGPSSQASNTKNALLKEGTDSSRASKTRGAPLKEGTDRTNTRARQLKEETNSSSKTNTNSLKKGADNTRTTNTRTTPPEGKIAQRVYLETSL